ncbi:MAG: bifunctional demethylmenaquinone methyltransferase/2-methoxy-6-polyprenyl-1,4-benzoquinol methylase UbiE [Candidatus Aminicenantia bacterium]
MDLESKKTQALFTTIAPKYDLLNHILSCFQDIGWRKKTASLLREKDNFKNSNVKILDLSTGTGDMIRALKNQFLNLSEIYGVDFSFKMLEIACDKLKHPLLIQAEINRLPFKSNTFDFLTISFGLRNLTNQQKSLKEILRVMKDKGKIAILEFSLPSNSFLKKIYYFYLSRIVPEIGRLIAKNYKAYYYLYSSIKNFPSPEEVINSLSQAGIKNIKIYSFTWGVVHLYIGEKNNVQ